MADTEIVADDKQAQLAFDSGFADTTPPAKVTPVVEAAPKVEPKPEVKTEPKVVAKVEPPKPEYVRLTKEQFARLDSAANMTADFGKRLDTALGTVGNMKQIITKLQSDTPIGAAVKLPDDVVSEMEKDFPELAGHLKSSLEKALKGIRGTAPAGAVLDPEETKKQIQAASEALITKLEIEALEDAYPDWRDIVGAVDSQGKFNPANPFRVWLGKQSAEYQHRLNSTNSNVIITRAIDKFKADTAKTAVPPKVSPKDAARRVVIQAAQQPRGDGGQPPPRNTEVDAFNEGFNSR